MKSKCFLNFSNSKDSLYLKIVLQYIYMAHLLLVRIIWNSLKELICMRYAIKILKRWLNKMNMSLCICIQSKCMLYNNFSEYFQMTNMRMTFVHHWKWICYNWFLWWYYKLDQNSWRALEIHWLKKSLEWNILDGQSLFWIANLVFQLGFMHQETHMKYVGVKYGTRHILYEKI